MDKELYDRELESLRKEVDQQGIRLTLAEAWIGFYRRAYSALKSYGIDFYKLKEYTQGYKGFGPGTDEVDKLPASQARDIYIAWIERMTNGLSAAIRRKNFTVHENPIEE